MNDLVKFGGGGLPANPEDLKKGLQHVRAGLTGRTGGTPILRLLQDGVFVYGQENIEPQEGSLWAVNPYSFQHGFACWGDGELLGEAMVPLTEPPPNVNELQDYGEPWQQQLSFQLQCLNGEDKGVTVLYKSTSVGFLNMAKTLIDQTVLQLQHDPDKFVPVVLLDNNYYHHKKYGKTYYPVLEVDHWISIKGTDAAEEAEETADAPDEDAEQAPAEDAKKQPRRRTSKRAKADDVQADHGEAEDDESGKDTDPPPRRRRRRAS